MKVIKTYLPYFLILVAFLIGQLTTPRPDITVVDKFKQEQRQHEAHIRVLKDRAAYLEKHSKEIERKMNQDRVLYSDSLKCKDLKIQKLTKRINEISLTTATTAQLDSIVYSLFPD